MTTTRVRTGLALLFGTLLAAGLPGVVERVVHEHANTAYDQGVPWGLWVAAYLFFSGASAGAFPIATLSHVFGQRRFAPLAPLSLLVALVCLSGAVVLVMADLGRPERALHLLRFNPTSVMFWVISLYTSYSLVLIGMLYLVLRPSWGAKARATGSRFYRWLALGHEDSDKQQRKDRFRTRVMGSFGLAVSFCLAAGVGMLFSVLPGRDFWHTGLFPITFLVSALVSGGALVIISASLFASGGRAFKETLLSVARLIGILLVVEAIILPVETLVVFKSGMPTGIGILTTIAAGPHAWVFWVLQFGIGTIAALLLILLPKKPTIAGAATASLFALIGTFAFRLNFVIPQQIYPSDSYIPSLYEWNLVIFGAGLAGLMFLAGLRWLPILPRETPIFFETAARGPSRSSRIGDFASGHG